MMDLDKAQESFVQLLGLIRQDCKLQFLEWMCKEYHPHALDSDLDLLEEKNDQETAVDTLEDIAKELRDSLPPNALSPDEPQFFPNKDSDAGNTLHIDSFLYPKDEDIDQLCSTMGVSRNYCLSCGSWQTAPLNFISHSMSHDGIRFIFNDLLPDLARKTVVDVGSRLGSILYGAFYLSKSPRIIGIEKNEYFCELQQKVLSQRNMGSRVQVVCSDVLDQGEVLTRADVVILNNVFEMFCSLEDRARIWEFLFTTIRKKGSLLVTVPSIQECWLPLPFKTDLDLGSWVVEVATGAEPEDEELGGLHLYCVKS